MRGCARAALTCAGTRRGKDHTRAELGHVPVLVLVLQRENEKGSSCCSTALLAASAAATTTLTAAHNNRLFPIVSRRRRRQRQATARAERQRRKKSPTLVLLSLSSAPSFCRTCTAHLHRSLALSSLAPPRASGPVHPPLHHPRPPGQRRSSINSSTSDQHAGRPGCRGAGYGSYGRRWPR